MKFYSPIEFSPHIRKTPEGFLACEGVAIARAGELEYGKDETPIDAGADGIVRITRSADVLMDKDCLASFESKPVTLDHPPDFVTPETFKEFAVGAVQNVRGDKDKIIADLLIMDARAIDAVEKGLFRELSCGYEADYERTAQGRGVQTKILGNHVALVSRGRCGASCAIFDKAPKKSEVRMKEKLLKLLGRAVDEAMPEPDDEKTADFDQANLAETLQSILARLDALENPKAADEEPPADEEKAPEDAPPADEEKAADAEVDIGERLNAIENVLKEILGKFATPDSCGEDKPENTFDAATLAAGEILAPELKPCKEYVAKALDAAYSTKDGRSVIDTLLCGRALDATDKTLFIAAAELLKNKRRVAFDTAPSLQVQNGVMTPERLNDLNSNFFKGK